VYSTTSTVYAGDWHEYKNVGGGLGIYAYRELPILVKELELAVVKAIPVRHASVA
jgi:hypothetical protein